MDGERFDALSRALARPRSRREVLKIVAVGVAGALAASVGGWLRAPTRALAAGRVDAPRGDPAPGSCAKQTYDRCASFVGDAMVADLQFFGALDALCGCARGNGVTLHVTASYRAPDPAAAETVDDPAKADNHEAGHALDVEVQYPNEEGQPALCDAGCLGGESLPPSVQGFLDCAQQAGLRWGGRFDPPDPGHLDDGLSARDGDGSSWKARRDALAGAGTCGGCQECNPASGACDTLPTCGETCCGAGHQCVDGQCQPCATGQAECRRVCCARGQVCADSGCCPPERVCASLGNVSQCCAEGLQCTARHGCCQPQRVCGNACCGDGERCLGSQCQPCPAVDLNGVWSDNGDQVRIIQDGASVTATYVLRPFDCDHRDGTGLHSQTSVDFMATLACMELTGETSTCRYGAGNNPGIVPAPMHLTVSEDGRTLSGTWQGDQGGGSITLTRLA